jgi:molybdenum cofactor cytidylyltransferase
MLSDSSGINSERRPGRTAAIILAAGESKRLGRPKQTVLFAGQTLLERTVTTVLDSPVDSVVVVVGANASGSMKVLRPFSVRVVENENWREGIGASIRVGLEALDNSPESTFDSALFLACDQPFLSAQLISDLLSEYQSGESLIVASSYADCLGIPALFSRVLFTEALQLQGDRGARALIRSYQEKSPETVSSVPFSGGEIDIDTTSDLSRLSAMSQDSVAQVDTTIISK